MDQTHFLAPFTADESIRTLNLTDRIRNCLLCHNVCTVQQLLALSERELFLVPNLGKKSLEYIKTALRLREEELKALPASSRKTATALPTPTCEALNRLTDGPWNDNSIQFPRLLAQIAATKSSVDLKALATSMNLEVSDIEALFERAQTSWALIQQNVPLEEKEVGVHYTVDGGVTMRAVHNDVRVCYAHVGDEDAAHDLLVTLTHEGVVLDFIEAETGAVTATGAYDIEDLVSLLRSNPETNNKAPYERLD